MKQNSATSVLSISYTWHLSHHKPAAKVYYNVQSDILIQKAPNNSITVCQSMC